MLRFLQMLVICLLFSMSVQAQVPLTSRSTAAAERVTPLLQAKLAKKGLELGAPLFVRIFKQESILELWLESEDQSFRLFEAYPICSFSGELGPKQRVGDLQSPEGFYFVTASRMNPWSQFHLSFNLGYPNAYDRYHGRSGSALMVHGDCVSIGCYAMTDAGIEEIYTLAAAALDGGQPFFRVHAFPFRMTKENMSLNERHHWIDFWWNLKQGYDWFELHEIPPNVEQRGGQYVFSEG
jgi:murein L,D-transpeptidase YafK